MADTRVMRGKWWLPEASFRDAVPGTLTLSEDELRLDLDEALFPSENRETGGLFHSAPEHVDRILGETNDGKLVTLVDCNLAQTRTRHTRTSGSHQYESFWPRVVCLGALFAGDEGVAFDVVVVGLSSLHPWTAVSGFDPEHQMFPHDDEDTMTQRYTPPMTRQADLGDGVTLKLEFPLDERNAGLYTYEKILTQATRFVVEFAPPAELVKVQEIVFTLRNFLTLAVGQGVKVTALSGYRRPSPTDETPIGREVEIVYRHLENPRAAEHAHHHGMLFLLSDLGDDFQRHMLSWFDSARDLGRVLDLYFSTRYADFVYLETRFINFVQAVEGYHRRRSHRTALDARVFDGYCESILFGVSGGARKLAKKALRHANEPSLEARIRDVMESLDAAALHVAGAGKQTVPSFANRAAAIRNTYSHNLEGEQPEHQEVVLRTYQLETLVEAVLLLELGFTAEKINTLFEEQGRYRFLRQVAKS